jgi:hypothetical protein
MTLEMQETAYSQLNMEPRFPCNMEGPSSSSPSFADVDGIRTSCSYVAINTVIHRTLMQQLAPGPDQTLASSTVVSTFSNLEFPQCEHFPSFEICKGFQDSPAFSEDRRVI